MTDRKTTTIKLSTGEDAVLYEYATGGDLMDLEFAAAEEAKIDNASKMNISASNAYRNYLKKQIELLVVKIGERSDVWEAMRALPGPDYNVIIKHITKACSGITAEESGK